MTCIYGIPHCGSVKKARSWLAAHGIDATWVDFKKTPPDEALLASWLEQIDLARLINRKGTTWRKLTDAEQAQADTKAGAIALMMAHPSVIKRPVLSHNEQHYVGFDSAMYADVFHTSKG